MVFFIAQGVYWNAVVFLAETQTQTYRRQKIEIPRKNYMWCDINVGLTSGRNENFKKNKNYGHIDRQTDISIKIPYKFVWILYGKSQFVFVQPGVEWISFLKLKYKQLFLM